MDKKQHTNNEREVLDKKVEHANLIFIIKLILGMALLIPFSFFHEIKKTCKNLKEYIKAKKRLTDIEKEYNQLRDKLIKR